MRPSPASGRLRLVIAPDSFKGSLTSVQVAAALADGWRRVRPADDIRLVPLADGGEGTLAAIEAAGGWSRREAAADDPLGRQIAAPLLLRDDGVVAVIEMATVSGLSLLADDELDSIHTTSAGTGDLLRAVLDAGVRDIVLGIGGSATTDGGAGMLVSLGASISRGDDRTPAVVDLAGLDPRLSGTTIRVACDVTNPLLGPMGAAAVYGPQKGAMPADVALLERSLARFATSLEAATGRHERDSPGAGAAGGVGFALRCLSDRLGTLAFLPGIDLVMDTTSFDEELASADLVITGEGRIDAQTACGKTAWGVARRAQDAGCRCVAVGGSVTPEGVGVLARLGAHAVPVSIPSLSVAEAMAAGTRPLVACGVRLAESVSSRSGAMWLAD